jgi:hypothetical protein
MRYQMLSYYPMRSNTLTVPTARRRTVRGIVHRRLLVNAVVDPDEAAARLPKGLRPHVTELGTVVGCCLLEIGQLRPAQLPARAGISLRAAAHRISVEWDDGTSEPVVGVYVPMRHTDSRVAVALGGRVFPGVHSRAHVHIIGTSDRLTWLVDDAHRAGGFEIRVGVSQAEDTTPTTACGRVAETCLGASLGCSPDHRGVLEVARMEPDHGLAQRVDIEDLDSQFLSGFSSARPAPAFLMQNVGVTWTPGPAPASAQAGKSA